MLKKLPGKHGYSRNGFTLIELVAVIVLLGILSASATAKFVSLQSDARAAILKNMQGNIRSANTMVFAKAMINGGNTAYSEKNSADKDWHDDCRNNNCVNVGDMWVYLKYAYIDRNSVAFIVDADISGIKTKNVTHGVTKKTVKVPDRTSATGDANYACNKDVNAVCKDHDFCQCRSQNEKINGGSGRDTQYIIPKGFKYYQSAETNPKNRCYFKYSSAEYLNNKVYPPSYVLETQGC